MIIQNLITKLKKHLDITSIDIRDDTYKHQRHKTHPSGSGHYYLFIVSPQFEGMPTIKRHRMVYGILEEELSSCQIHALSMTTLTPTEVADKAELK